MANLQITVPTGLGSSRDIQEGCYVKQTNGTYNFVPGPHGYVKQPNGTYNCVPGMDTQDTFEMHLNRLE